MANQEKPSRLSVAMHIAKVFFYRWGIMFLAAFFLTWYLQYRSIGNEAEEAWRFLDEHAEVFWYSVVVMLSILAVFYGIFRGPFKAVAVLFGVITIIGYINITKFKFRGSPLLPEDFQLSDQAGTLTKFIDIGELARNIVAVVLAVGLGFLLDYLTLPYLRYLPRLQKLKNAKKKTKKQKKAYRSLVHKKALYFFVPRVIVVSIAVAAFLVVANPVLNHGGKKEDWLPEIGAHFISWSQNENYDENGFLVGFLYNIKKQSMTAPSDYSENSMAQIAKDYEKDKANDGKTSLKDTDYNIVIILNESFYDPAIISDYYQIEGVDVVPNFHRIQKEYPSGYMYSPDYGGGTANIEFEVLTGLSNYWANTVPYTDILTKVPDITSISKDAKSAGYKTTAIHSFTGEMYKRQIALAKEGFDQFITEDQMTHTEKEGAGEYIKDSELYAEIMDQLEKDDDKQLIFAITMQNHAPYAYGKYPHDSYEFWVPRLTDDFDRHASVLSYLQTLYYSDAYMGEFLDNLKNSDEKTVVLFFGDHSPGVFPDVHDSGDKAISDLSHLTPYFIWTNFGADEASSDEEEMTELSESEPSTYATDFLKKFDVPDSFKAFATNITLPTTTPNCLTNTMYNLLKIKNTPLRNLLNQVCTKVPILAATYLGSNSPENEKVFKDYEFLNYDILGGKQYWLK